ncbi:cupin domain-containing protein [Novipirellula sp. SH528]|uniref:cupin domain-containing protein n=1 Tax=Novipirellula sp. SH528 TaxID=3454466 RepID=UPI003FA0E3F9
MSDLSTSYVDLAAEVAIQEGGTISKTLYQDASLKVVLFGFDAGQELSEHTAAVPAVLQFLDGNATVTLGEKSIDASANTFIHMAANLSHSITANQPTKMLLLLLKGAKPDAHPPK